jgi:hypothetical protein
MPRRHKPFSTIDVVVDLARLVGLGPLPRDGGGCLAKDVPAPSRIVACAYGALADLPPPEPRREDETPEQRQGALEARTRLAMAAGVDPAVIARAAPPLMGRTRKRWDHISTDEVARQTCFLPSTFVPDTPGDPSGYGVANVPFFEYLIEWLAATGHIVVFCGVHEIKVYPTTASPAHVHARDSLYHDQEDEWGAIQSWSQEVGRALGTSTVYYMDGKNDALWESGCTDCATFTGPYGCLTRNQLRLCSPYFEAAYRRFVERTTARNLGSFVRRHGHGDVSLSIKINPDLYYRYPDGKSNDHFETSRSDVHLSLIDPLAHIEAMGRSGVAAPQDVRDLLRAWRVTEVIDEPPAWPRLPNGDFVSFDEPEEYDPSSPYSVFADAFHAWGESASEIVEHPDAARFGEQKRAVIALHIRTFISLEAEENKERLRQQQRGRGKGRGRSRGRGRGRGQGSQGSQGSQPQLL